MASAVRFACAIGGSIRDTGHGSLWLSGMAGRDVFNPAQSLVRGLDPVRGSNGAKRSGPNGPAARSARLGAPDMKGIDARSLMQEVERMRLH